MSNSVIQEMEDHIAFLESENKKLREENAKLKSDASWQYEYDHADDWRKPVEMGQL